jgi:transposase
MQGLKSYRETLFVCFRLSERVPQNNFYRRLKETLNLSYLRKMTAKYYGTEEQKSIDTEVFFKLMLIGYIENINSGRKLNETAQMRPDMLYFPGYDIDGPLPRHSTLSRRRKLFGESVFLEFFRQMLRLCIENGMVSGRRQAVDSAFVKANASLSSPVEREMEEESMKYYKELSSDEENTGEESTGKENTHREKVRRERPGKTGTNDTCRSTTDPDARVSQKHGKVAQLNYLGQISVDTDSHVICGAMADYAYKRDSQSTSAIVGQTTENLSESGISVKEIPADTGYGSGESPGLSEKAGYLNGKDLPTFGRKTVTFAVRENACRLW